MDPMLLEQLVQQINYKQTRQPIQGAVLHISAFQNLLDQLQYAIENQGVGYGKVIDKKGTVTDLTGDNIKKVPQHMKKAGHPARLTDVSDNMKKLSNSNTVSVGLLGNSLNEANKKSLLETLAQLVVDNNIPKEPNSNVYSIYGHGELQGDHGRPTMGKNKTPEGAEFANLFRSPSSSYADFMNRVDDLKKKRKK